MAIAIVRTSACRPLQIREKRRLAQQQSIDVRFVDHERFVAEVMTIPPSLKVVAALHREGWGQ